MHAMVEGWLDGFREAARAVRRLGPADGVYAAELSDNYAISDALSRVRRALLAAETGASEIRGRYLEYSFLWTRDLNAALEVTVWINAQIPGLQRRYHEGFGCDISGKFDHDAAFACAEQEPTANS